MDEDLCDGQIYIIYDDYASSISSGGASSFYDVAADIFNNGGANIIYGHNVYGSNGNSAESYYNGSADSSYGSSSESICYGYGNSIASSVYGSSSESICSNGASRSYGNRADIDCADSSYGCSTDIDEEQMILASAYKLFNSYCNPEDECHRRDVPQGSLNV
ncbi:hypothetical protein IWW48_006397 [Coemansia sp. RSA 1200]|nr:hypothetical protein IWW48_006397 [Coemansia sp. RSA 1200]